MPVFDFLAIGRVVARGIIIMGFVAYVVSSVMLVVEVMTKVVNIFNTSLNSVSSVVSSNLGNSEAGNTVRCFFHLLHLLGIDSIFNSFLVSIISLGMLWAGITLNLMLIRAGFVFKGLLLKATFG